MARLFYDPWIVNKASTISSNEPVPYCTSYKCINNFKGGNLSHKQIDEMGNPKIKKEGYRKTEIFCHDCNSALFWSRE